jgi:hypothetical protein
MDKTIEEIKITTYKNYSEVELRDSSNRLCVFFGIKELDSAISLLQEAKKKLEKEEK